MAEKASRKWVITLREILALRRNGYSGPFFVSAAMLLMGVWLMLPLRVFENQDVYGLMSSWAIEEMWGLMLTGCSLIMLFSSLRRKPQEVALGALMSAFLWFLLLASFASGKLSSLLVPMSMVMTLRCMSLFKEFRNYFDPVTGEREDEVRR